MFISLSIAGFALLCIAPAFLDAREDRRFRRDFQREQHADTLRIIRTQRNLQLGRPEEAQGLYKIMED